MLNVKKPLKNKYFLVLINNYIQGVSNVQKQQSGIWYIRLWFELTSEIFLGTENN